MSRLVERVAIRPPAPTQRAGYTALTSRCRLLSLQGQKGPPKLARQQRQIGPARTERRLRPGRQKKARPRPSGPAPDGSRRPRQLLRDTRQRPLTVALRPLACPRGRRHPVDAAAVAILKPLRLKRPPLRTAIQPPP